MEEVLNNLTIYQKAALESDVAELLKASSSDADILYNLYYLMKHIPEDIKLPFFAVAKGYLFIPEEKINKLLVYLSSEEKEFPEWLWLEKVVADIRVALATCCSEMSTVTVHVDKKAMKQNLVKSAFVKFIRKIAMFSKEHAIKACNTVLEEMDLRFLSDVCCALKEDVQCMKNPNKFDLNNLFKIELDCKMGLLSYTEETDTLNRMLMIEENPDEFLAKAKEELQGGERKSRQIVWSGKSNQDILSAAFEQMQSILDSARAEVEGKKEAKKDVVYLVSKVFKGREGEMNVLREFKTAEEAREFVKSMETQYPELLNTCRFVISEKYANGGKEV